MLDDAASPVLGRPGRISQDERGRYFVADVSDHNIKVYDGSGRRVATYGAAGEGPGEFRTLFAVSTFKDSLVALDVTDSEPLTILDRRGEFARSMEVAGGSVPRDLRVTEAGLFLIIHAGRNDQDLMRLMQSDGTPISAFQPGSEYYTGGPEHLLRLRQYSSPIGDGRAGCVWATFTMSDSIAVYDYSGDMLASGPIAPGSGLFRLKDALIENDDRAKTPAGLWLWANRQAVIDVVALNRCAALVQVNRYGANGRSESVMAEEPETDILLLGAMRNGDIGLMDRQRIRGRLAGTARNGEPLILQYSATTDAYIVRRLLIGSGGVGGGSQ